MSSQTIERELIGFGLAPEARVRMCSAAVAHAAASRVPLALSAPDSSVALAYYRLVERMEGVSAR